jgi:hypothetical protein
MTLVAGSYFHRKRFMISFLAGFLVLAMIIAAFILSGIAFAFPITGIGGFDIYADQILGGGFLLGLTTNDTSYTLSDVYAQYSNSDWGDGTEKQDTYPLGIVTLKGAVITDLTLTKDIQGLSAIALPFDKVRVWIKGGDLGTPVTGGYLTLNIDGLVADVADFHGLLVDEQGPSQNTGLPLPFGPKTPGQTDTNYLRQPLAKGVDLDPGTPGNQSTEIIPDVYISADPDGIYADDAGSLTDSSYDMKLTNATINTHMLYAGNISIPAMRLRIIVDPTDTDETTEMPANTPLPADPLDTLPQS